MTPAEATVHAALHAALAAGDTRTVDAITAGLDAEDNDRRVRLAAPGALAAAARWYAGQGIQVFPLIVGGKTPATRHGLHDGTTDLDQVEAWWARTPQANIGLPTGHLFDVVDVDMPDGYFSLGVMRERGLLPAIHGRSITASGGTHLFIRPTGDGNGARIQPGVDYRGLGGYVVGAPSRSAEGAWIWTTPLDLEGLA